MPALEIYRFLRDALAQAGGGQPVSDITAYICMQILQSVSKSNFGEKFHLFLGPLSHLTLFFQSLDGFLFAA